MAGRWRMTFALLGVLAGGCAQEERRDWVLPEPTEVASWFGTGTEARISGNVVEIRGVIAPEFLRRGGSLWARSGPYFYLFNVHVRDLLVKYPDVAAVRAIAVTHDGRELARATLNRGELSEYQWREALALASLAQTEGTEHPRRVDDLIRWGEDHTEFTYAK